MVMALGPLAELPRVLLYYDYLLSRLYLPIIKHGFIIIKVYIAVF